MHSHSHSGTSRSSQSFCSSNFSSRCCCFQRKDRQRHSTKQSATAAAEAAQPASQPARTSRGPGRQIVGDGRRHVSKQHIHKKKQRKERALPIRTLRELPSFRQSGRERCLCSGAATCGGLRFCAGFWTSAEVVDGIAGTFNNRIPRRSTCRRWKRAAGSAILGHFQPSNRRKTGRAAQIAP